MGGNIGTAILALQPPASDRTHVIEMSSFQIELTPTLEPTIGILLNVSPDHLDRHGTMKNYASLKARLVQEGTAPLSSVKTTSGAAMFPTACGWPIETWVDIVSADLRVLARLVRLPAPV